jgi:hypothetical protein
MTDSILPDFGRSEDMVLPVFDRGALAVAEQKQQRQRGEPNLPAPAYPPAVDLGFGGPARDQMTFGENFRGAGSGADLIGVMGEAASIEAARGAPQPGGFQPSQLRNLPARVRQRIEAESTPEDMAARREAAYNRVFEQAAYDLSQSRITPQSVGGVLARGLMSPENLVSLPANVLRRGAAAVAGRFGPAAGRVAESAIDAAVTNTAIDPLLQAGRLQSGGQEAYSPEQTALAPIVGGAAGAAIRGVIEAPSFARREAQALGVTPQAARVEPEAAPTVSVGTEATGAPARAAGEARIIGEMPPAAREGGDVPEAGPVQRQAEAVSPEPARTEAPAGVPADRVEAVAPEQIVGAPDGGRNETGNAGDAGRLPEGLARDQGQEAQAGGQATSEARVVERDGIRFNDTRGTGSQLHGTSEPDLQPYGEHYSTKNYYGQGFYTTDAADVAYGYSRRGSQRTGGRFVYRVEETRPLRILDGEAEIPANLRQLLEPDDTGRASDIEDVLRMAFDEKPKNVRELYDNIREIGTGEGLSADTIQEIFDVVNYHTRSLGFDGMSHLGGLRTNTAPHRVVIYFNPETDIRVTRADLREFAAPEPARVAANDAGQQQFAAMARQADAAVQRSMADNGIAPMARQTNDRTADRAFPGRRELAGETSKPRALPENATPDEIRNTRLGDAQQELAARIGRKLEVDNRFSLRNAEGQYDFKQGVIRVRQYGDMETFSHELGHALEQQIRTDLGARFDAILTRHGDELKRLDANTSDPGAQTAREGLGEFIRMLINNPAFAARQAPNFATAFDSLLTEGAPGLRQLIADASRLSQIDSGRNPVQAAEAMIRPAVDPRGLAEVREINRKAGLPTTIGVLMDRFFVNVTGKDHYGKRLLRNLQDAQFEKTGKPMDEFGWDNPHKSLRALPSAKQTGIDSIQNGVRAFGRYADGPVSPSVRDALKEAGGGNLAKMTDETTPEYRAFSAYTTMRAARGRYLRFIAGDVPKAPVRMSMSEVERAIADFEAANPTFKSAADKIFAYNRAQWRRLFDAGIIDKEMFEAVAGRGEDYVPLNRYFDDREPGGSGGGVNAPNSIRAAKGSTRDILDPIQQTMLNTAQFERVIALNEINKAYAKVAEAGGEFAGKFWERVPNSQMKGQSVDILEAVRSKARESGLDKADTETILRTIEEFVGEDATARVFRSTDIKADTGENILFVWEGGQRQAYKLANDEMTRGFYDLIANMTEADRDFWKKIMGTGNAMFSQFITNAPQFALKNLLMDAITRAPMARHTGLLGRIPLAPLAAGIWTSIADKEFAKAYAASGGIRGGVVSSALRDLEKTGGLSAIDIGAAGVGQRLADAGGDLRQPGTYIPAVLGATGERVREFGQTLAHPTSWPKAALESVQNGVKSYFKLLEATETVGRVGQTKIVYNHLRKQGLDHYTAFNAAVFEGRDVLDYDRRGAAMEGFTRFLPFLNPGIQGTARANKNLIGDPLAAAVQAYKRGGYDKLDGEYKSALRDAAINWGVIAAMVTASLGWWAAVKDDPIYQRTTEYMRKRYWIIPLREGQNGEDDQYISIPKPFDLPGALIAAMEGAAEGISRADPEGAHRVFGALREGFIPRQFGGLQDFLGSNPFFKTGYEVQLGQRMGFEGSAPSPIIPQQLRKLTRAEQFSGNTSEFARRMGQQFNLSPLIVDHVINGLGGTAGRDVNDALTATLGNNPNMTPGDAFTKMFFGALIRRQRGVGQMRNELNRLMSADEAKYRAPANSYAEAIRLGRWEAAEQGYAAQDDIGKTLMTVSGHSFSTGNRNLHPLEHAESFAKLASAVTRDISLNRLVVQDRSAARGQEREIIRVDPAVARGITNTINSWASEEIKNGLTIAGMPGYREMQVTDTAARLSAIRSLSPEVAAEIEARMKASAILSPIHVRDNWAEARRRLLADRQNADLTDLMPQELRRQSTQSRRRRQRAEESNNAD